LIETFFTSVPRVSRVVHRGNLIRRIHLPPTHPDFPLPALLHAICAAAAGYTAWVHTLPATSFYPAVTHLHPDGKSLADSEDFALAQAEACRRAIHEGHHLLWANRPNWAHEHLQAQAIVLDVWYSRGLYSAGSACLADAIRHIKELDITNRNGYREGPLIDWMPPPTSSITREERLGLVWQVFSFDAFLAVCRNWSGGLDEGAMYCRLPASTVEFQGSREADTPQNPQYAKDLDLYLV
jgi:hypothetical protein